ncbi:hypothetical protein [Pontiella sp.]|uniref:hypothetical protein n=1 Tax=Pontiella sp. TaxID=2837462 RepID=UPI00356A1F19
MNWVKHILVVLALLFSALPCVHAEDHAGHLHDNDASQQLCTAHDCGCHTCDEASCPEELDVETHTVSISVAVNIPPGDIVLFVYTESKPVLRRAASPVYSALSALKTVHLLI